MDSKTRKQIEEVFEIENSTAFKFEQFISYTLDPIFRVGYANSFFFFQIYYISLLYQISWLVIVISVLFSVLGVVWILYYIITRMKKSNIGFFEAICYYCKCYHIVPKAKKQTKIVDDDVKRKGAKDN